MITKSDHNSNSNRLLVVCLVVASAYFARDVLMPLALAMLFAFLLAPLAKRLEHFHLGHITSALVSVLLGILVIGTLSYVIVVQFGEFGKELPKYEQQIHARLRSLGAANGGALKRASESLQDFRKDLTPTNSTPTNSASSTNSIQEKTTRQPEEKAVPVEVRNSNSSVFEMIRNIIGPFLSVLTTAFLVVVFCIFMLVGRDDLRARVIRVAGPDNAKLTKQVLTETGQRVSRYLLMQLIVNVTYAIPIGLGLWAIGIPNPLLWCMLAALFRYIPYAGPWIAASFPLLVAVAIGSGWSQPALVFGLFCVVEILTANVFEPLLYGSSIGITPIAVLLAAVFWTWLWGPIGLLLSMPLTVCLMSLARHVPQLELLDKLFTEEKK